MLSPSNVYSIHPQRHSDFWINRVKEEFEGDVKGTSRLHIILADQHPTLSPITYSTNRDLQVQPQFGDH